MPKLIVLAWNLATCTCTTKQNWLALQPVLHACTQTSSHLDTSGLQGARFKCAVKCNSKKMHLCVWAQNEQFLFKSLINTHIWRKPWPHAGPLKWLSLKAWVDWVAPLHVWQVGCCWVPYPAKSNACSPSPAIRTLWIQDPAQHAQYISMFNDSQIRIKDSQSRRLFHH